MERDKKYIAVMEESTSTAAIICLMDENELGMLFMACLKNQPEFPDQKSPEAQVNRMMVTLAGELLYRRKYHGDLPRDENAEDVIKEIQKIQNPPIM